MEIHHLARAAFVALLLVPFATKARAARCNRETQPAPHWGVKNGRCLKSCGAAGGTGAFSDRCENHGKVSAGLAYDVAFCCKAGAAGVAAASPLMKKCFCSKLVGGSGLQRYQIMEYPTVPQCSGVIYQSTSRGPLDLLSCDSLGECARLAGQCDAQMTAMQRRLSSANPTTVMRVANEFMALSNRCLAVNKKCFVDTAGSTGATCEQLCSSWRPGVSCGADCVRYNRSCPRNSGCDPSVRMNVGEPPRSSSTPTRQ